MLHKYILLTYLDQKRLYKGSQPLDMDVKAECGFSTVKVPMKGPSTESDWMETP